MHKFHFTDEHIKRHALEKLGLYEMLDRHMHKHHSHEGGSYLPIDDLSERKWATLMCAYDRIKKDVLAECKHISHGKIKKPLPLEGVPGNLGYYNLPDDYESCVEKDLPIAVWNGKKVFHNPGQTAYHYYSTHKVDAAECEYAQEIADLLHHKFCHEAALICGSPEHICEGIWECVEEAIEDMEEIHKLSTHTPGYSFDQLKKGY